MVARKDEEANFIAEIYNYCDRWCERCPMTDHCLLFYRESIRRTQHQNKGEDPDDWNIVAQDVEEDLQEAMQLLEKMADERGIDLNEVSKEEEEKVDITKHPLRVKAHQFAMDSHKFLDELCNFIHEEERKGIPAEQVDELQDCFQILSWYHMQIAVKIDRALNGKLKEEKRKEHSELNLRDSDGSAKVAYLGLLKSLDALSKIYECNQTMHTDVMPLLTTIYELTEQVNQEFPGHKTFKRPGFDY